MKAPETANDASEDMSSHSAVLSRRDDLQAFSSAASSDPPTTFRINPVLPQLPVHCFGDSHMAVFSGQALRSSFPFIRWFTTVVEGATASGLANPNSKSQASRTYADELTRITPGALLICCLGEVDMGFAVWIKSASRGTTLFNSFLTAVKNYENFLRGLAARHTLIVLSAPLPTIQDGAQTGIVGNLRKEVSASQRDRTALTIAFNKRIGRFCQRSHIEYVSLDQMSLDPTTGVVKSILRHSNATDHHYCPIAYSEMLAASLSPTLTREWIKAKSTPNDKPFFPAPPPIVLAPSIFNQRPGDSFVKLAPAAAPPLPMPRRPLRSPNQPANPA